MSQAICPITGIALTHDDPIPMQFSFSHPLAKLSNVKIAFETMDSLPSNPDTLKPYLVGALFSILNSYNMLTTYNQADAYNANLAVTKSPASTYGILKLIRRLLRAGKPTEETATFALSSALPCGHEVQGEEGKFYPALKRFIENTFSLTEEELQSIIEQNSLDLPDTAALDIQVESKADPKLAQFWALQDKATAKAKRSPYETLANQRRAAVTYCYQAGLINEGQLKKARQAMRLAGLGNIAAILSDKLQAYAKTLPNTVTNLKPRKKALEAAAFLSIIEPILESKQGFDIMDDCFASVAPTVQPTEQATKQETLKDRLARLKAAKAKGE